VRVVVKIVRTARALLQRVFRRQTKPDQDLSGTFLKLALQYYLAGRSAYFAFSMPVAGNILHHAVEMLLKSLLAEKGFIETELQFKFGHNVKRLWRTTKRTLADPGLGIYDPVIRRLAPMWGLRYPRRDRSRYSFQLSLRKEPATPATGDAAKDLPHYHLSLEEVDELMKALLTKITTPGWVSGRLGSGDGRAQYLRDNFHSFI
jgi:hypothetical protein